MNDDKILAELKTQTSLLRQLCKNTADSAIELEKLRLALLGREGS